MVIKYNHIILLNKDCLENRGSSKYFISSNWAYIYKDLIFLKEMCLFKPKHPYGTGIWMHFFSKEENISDCWFNFNILQSSPDSL